MAFDCIIIDFKNKDSNKNLSILYKSFPHARVIPFVSSYFDIAKSVLGDSRTEYTWLLSSKVDYSDFDFNFIPEQHQRTQLHVWNNKNQKEGDTFLFPKCFLDQKIRFLRDYKDVNYHEYNVQYDFDFYDIGYDLSNVIHNIPTIQSANASYIRYYETLDDKDFYPSYWEDLKVYKDKNTFYIPKKALGSIKTQIYDYPLLYIVNEVEKKDCFDIAFISNGEPFEDTNFKILKDHLEKNNLSNRLYWIKGVDGRTKAYKKAAETSDTEYFYAVFAKSMVKDTFMFDYTVDRGLSKRHRIFHARLNELDLEYGTFNIDLYSKSLCIHTPDDNILDFTLSQPHEVVPVVASESLLAPDNYTAWKNAFREVSKLVLWQNKKPTVETRHRLKKWLETDNEWLAKGSQDGKLFTEECEYDEDKILQTYTWDFCRDKFKSLYPTETVY
tara:strand:+ start:1144 stop:2469 length:1326 start_codon:yes stop_codon:yes gene_type:complete